MEEQGATINCSEVRSRDLAFRVMTFALELRRILRGVFALQASDTNNSSSSHNTVLFL